MIRRLTAGIRAGGGQEQGRAIGLLTVRSFATENAKNVAFAPTSLLVAYARAQSRLFEVMARDNETTCALVATAQLPKGGSGPNSADIGNATAAVLVIMLQAAREGIDHPSRRVFQILTPQEQVIYRDALLRQYKGDLRLLKVAAGDANEAQVSRHDQCTVGLATASAIASLPDELAAKVVANTLTGS